MILHTQNRTHIYALQLNDRSFYHHLMYLVQSADAKYRGKLSRISMALKILQNSRAVIQIKQ